MCRSRYTVDCYDAFSSEYLCLMCSVKLAISNMFDFCGGFEQLFPKTFICSFGGQFLSHTSMGEPLARFSWKAGEKRCQFFRCRSRTSQPFRQAGHEIMMHVWQRKHKAFSIIRSVACRSSFRSQIFFANFLKKIPHPSIKPPKIKHICIDLKMQYANACVRRR